MRARRSTSYRAGGQSSGSDGDPRGEAESRPMSHFPNTTIDFPLIPRHHTPTPALPPERLSHSVSEAQLAFPRSSTPHRRGRGPKRDQRRTDSSPIDSQHADGPIKAVPPHSRILERRKRRAERDTRQASDETRKGSAAAAARPKPPAEPFAVRQSPAEPAASGSMLEQIVAAFHRPATS